MRVRLATKFSLLVLAVLLLAVSSSSMALYSSWKLEFLLQSTVSENLASVRAAEELEIALLEQRGLVASYILDDRNPKWLEKLGNIEPQFGRWLHEARNTAHSPEEEGILDQLSQVYREYHERRQAVIRLCDQNEVAQATAVLLNEVQQSYRKAFDLCESFLAANERSVGGAVTAARRHVQKLTVVMAILAVATLLTSGSLLWLFFHGVLFPLRRMVGEMRIFAEEQEDPSVVGSQDELAEIRDYLRALMSDITGARSTLQLRQSQLAQAEKLASLGKLAASVAHEIRNPLTAMKMWLFSLRRSVGPAPDSDRQFELISEELGRLETVVQNFLEFSRSPELKLRPLSVAELLNKTLELLRPRLESRGVVLQTGDVSQVGDVLVDAEQMRQVLINLLINAVEAAPDGGRIEIAVQHQEDIFGEPMVVLRVRDYGRGMSDEERDMIFQPFFTTKEQGTGLGLCIAARIMASHGGRLVLESTSDHGSTFAMWIPRP
jgi:signal transduction histidine kinase